MLRAWCKKHNYNNARNLSHVLMDGGVLSIPCDKLRDFYDVYIASVKAEEKVYVVEQKTETYNFFMDVDYKDEAALTPEQVKSVCQIICDKVLTFSASPCIISVSEPKPKDGKIKTGIHINWSELVVNQDGAIQLMHHVVSTLEKIYSAKDWVSVIDSSVYGTVGTKGSGFRLPWSHKKTSHQTCKGVGCTDCDKGKIIEGEYLPVFMYSSGHIKPTSQEITMENLLLSTVRTTETVVTVIPELVMICKPIRRKVVHKEGDFTNAETKDEIHDMELLSLLETFIRKNMTGQEDTRVFKIFKFKNIFLLKTSSKYCENIKRSHNSNHIKLIIDNGNIYQRCFCTCETTIDRQLGFCKNFSGRKHKLESKICAILYPDKKCRNL